MTLNTFATSIRATIEFAIGGIEALAAAVLVATIIFRVAAICSIWSRAFLALARITRFNLVKLYC